MKLLSQTLVFDRNLLFVHCQICRLPQASILSKHVTSHERVNAGKEEHLFGIPPNLAKEREMEDNMSFNCDKCLFVSQSAQGME